MRASRGSRDSATVDGGVAKDPVIGDVEQPGPKPSGVLGNINGPTTLVVTKSWGAYIGSINVGVSCHVDYDLGPEP
jgi:hypothetical protein